MSSESTVRVQDDLYKHVNGEWLKTAVIPDDKPTTGGFSSLRDEVEELLMSDFDKFAKGEEEPGLPIMEDAVRLYRKALDTSARAESAIKPIYPLLEKIRGLKSIADFNEKAFGLFKESAVMPLQMGVMEDWKDTSRHCFALMDPVLFLPDTSYYEKPVMKLYMKTLFGKMMSKLLEFTPLTKKERRQYLKDAFAFDDLIRRKALSSREMADYYKLYNPMDAAKVYECLAPFDLAAILKKLYGEGAPETIVAANPRFIEGFKEIFNEKTFPLYVHWCYIFTVKHHAPALSVEISELSKQYENKLTGVKKNPSVEKQAYRLASELFDQPIGVYYGRRYFGEAAKADVTEMVERIIATYEKRVAGNEFLAEETKRKAIKKLSAIRIKMGYPDDYDEFYDRLKVSEEESFFEAAERLFALTRDRELEKLNKPTDRGKWQMPAHMVNACYDPFRNDITFPAAILQKPFYSLKQKPEENLGGIGAVIGHEISHAFDNNGSHFDENGNLSDWWKEEDFKTFEEKTKAMTEQFDGIPFHGGKVNGGLVVSENIADNGGMAVTLDMMHDLPGADFKAYFLNWGRIWCMKAKESYMKLLLTLDVHSPCELRANMMPRNFKEWYEAFGVKDTDGMYLPEDKRIIIW